MALKNHFILPTNQVRADHRHAAGHHPIAHRLLALVALSDMKWRRIDDRQQLRARFNRQTRRLLEPGVLADHQSHAHLVSADPGIKNANTMTRREIAPFVEDLVIGQLTLGIGRDHRAFANHAGGVETA